MSPEVIDEEDAEAIAQGLQGYSYDAKALVNAILNWTGGQPFLAQRLCQITIRVLEGELVLRSAAMPRDPVNLIDAIVRGLIIEHWESQDNSEHLRTIRDRLLRKELFAPRLLGIYQSILLAFRTVENRAKAIAPDDVNQLLAYDDSPEQIDLLLSGVIRNAEGRLQVKSRIYLTIFNMDWVQRQLDGLRPYARQLISWQASDETDEFRLLRGKALKAARSQERSVGEVDRAFLMASERYDRRITQELLRSARVKEVEKRLEFERRARRRQRSLISGLVALAIAIGLGTTARVQYQRARRTEAQAIVTTSEALYSSDQRLDALVSAIHVDRYLREIGGAKASGLREQAMSVLRTVAVGVVEKNRLAVKNSNFWDVDASLDGKMLVTGSADGRVRLWGIAGNLIETFSPQEARVRAVAFFPTGDRVVSASDDRRLKIRDLEGNVLYTLRSHRDAVLDVDVSGDGRRIASASGDSPVKLWAGARRNPQNAERP